MTGDRVLTPEEADNFQAEAQAADELLIWTVYLHPIDYPGQCIARPHGSKIDVPFKVVLRADTIEQLRASIPRGLICLGRDPDDDPKIVESWI